MKLKRTKKRSRPELRPLPLPTTRSVKRLPKSDPVRDRNIRDVQTEVHRLLMAVDNKKKYGTINGLGNVCAILRACYTVIDLTEESK